MLLPVFSLIEIHTNLAKIVKWHTHTQKKGGGGPFTIKYSETFELIKFVFKFVNLTHVQYSWISLRGNIYVELRTKFSLEYFFSVENVF